MAFASRARACDQPIDERGGRGLGHADVSLALTRFSAFCSCSANSFCATRLSWTLLVRSMQVKGVIHEGRQRLCGVKEWVVWKRERRTQTNEDSSSRDVSKPGLQLLFLTRHLYLQRCYLGVGLAFRLRLLFANLLRTIPVSAGIVG